MSRPARSRYSALAFIALIAASCASTSTQVQTEPSNSATPGAPVDTTAFATTTALAGTTPTNAPGECSAPTIIAGEPTPAHSETTVCVPQPSTPLEVLRDEIQSHLDWNSGRIVTVGLNGTATAVEIDLRADAVDIAADLVKHYGSKVVVRLGLFAYPPASSAEGTPVPPCGDTPPTPTDADAALLAVTVEPSGAVHSGADGTAVVHVRNVGPKPYALMTGQSLIGVLVRAGTRMIIGTSTGGNGLVGLSITLQPGQETTINATWGTASCDEKLGYALPPGDYELVGLLERSGPDGLLPSIPSAPATVHIIP